MAIKTAKELAAAAENAAKYFKTLYVMGCFGAPMNSKNKDRYCRNHSYNRQTKRTVKIKAATADTFGFDCGRWFSRCAADDSEAFQNVAPGQISNGSGSF